VEVVTCERHRRTSVFVLALLEVVEITTPTFLALAPRRESLESAENRPQTLGNPSETPKTTPFEPFGGLPGEHPGSPHPESLTYPRY
jgi:hypothetical protein